MGLGTLMKVMVLSGQAKTQIQLQIPQKQDSDEIIFILKNSIAPTVLEKNSQTNFLAWYFPLLPHTPVFLASCFTALYGKHSTTEHSIGWSKLTFVLHNLSMLL